MSASDLEKRTYLVGIPRVGKREGGGVDPGPGPELAPQENKVFFCNVRFIPPPATVVYAPHERKAEEKENR